MKAVKQTALFVALYIIFLAYRFPYEAVVVSSIDAFSRSTGFRVTYSIRSASLFGVYLEKIHVESPAGMKIDFGSAKLVPGLGTISAFLTQPAGSLTINSERDGTVRIQPEKIGLESGMKELGTARITGDLNYNIYQKRGGGDLSIEVAKPQLPLPTPDGLELGTKLAYEQKDGGYEVKAEVHLVGGGGQSEGADGNVMVEPQPQQPGKLSGTLRVHSALKSGSSTLRLSGTWRKPQFAVVKNQ